MRLREAFDDHRDYFQSYDFQNGFAKSIIDDPTKAEDYIRLLEHPCRNRRWSGQLLLARRGFLSSSLSNHGHLETGQTSLYAPAHTFRSKGYRSLF